MPHLRICLLGQPRVELDGSPLIVDTRKTFALLLLLAVDRPTLRREFLVNLLWPEKNRKKGEDLLRHSLYILKKTLPPELIHADRDTVSIATSEEVWIDLTVFCDLLDAQDMESLRQGADSWGWESEAGSHSLWNR